MQLQSTLTQSPAAESASLGMGGGDGSHLKWVSQTLQQDLHLQIKNFKAIEQKKLRRLKIHVERTFPFETCVPIVNRAMSIWNASADFTFSDYDVSLAGLVDIPTLRDKDLILCWVDWRLYKNSKQSIETVVAMLFERIHNFRNYANVPVVLNTWPLGCETEENIWVNRLNDKLNLCVEKVPEIILLSLHDLQIRASTFPWFDERNDQLAKIPFSFSAMNVIGHHLGGEIVPYALGCRIRAIIVDADDTLYRGTLAEDTAEKVVLTDGHRDLQEYLLSLKKKGVLLGLLSRNVEQDLKDLFFLRPDFPLRWEDFAACRVDWKPKVEGLVAILEQLRFDGKYVAMIDDNIAELVKLGSELDVSRLLACKDAKSTSRALSRLAGIWSPHGIFSLDGNMRTRDVQANQQRHGARNNARTEAEFLNELDMEINISLDDKNQVARAAEISQKTNQFNVSLARMSASGLIEGLTDRSHLVTVCVKDLLSDSGTVGMSSIQLRDKTAHFLEFCLSCRALGRRIEDFWLYSILLWLRKKRCSRVTFYPRKGPRNHPALKWLQSLEAIESDVSIAQLMFVLEKRIDGFQVRRVGDI